MKGSLVPTNRLTIGFTGTQNGMNAEQLEELTNYLRLCYDWCRNHDLRPVFRHGDCIGADNQAATTASLLGYYVISHPCTISYKRAWNPNSNEVMKPKPPLERNHDIVDQSDYMVATPFEEATDPEPLRSGTWATIRYCRKRLKHVTVLYA
jgi:hypothetical protein